MNERLNPPTLATPNGFVHVVKSTGGTLLHISGQVAYDSDGNVVGVGDLAAQVAQVYRNIETILAAYGAKMSDLVKTTLFVRDMTPERIAIIRDVRKRFLVRDHLPASTMVGVAALARPELMLEVEALAVLD
ncbi:MAG: RidA family protein [Geminicoccaceae bacterium]